MSLKSLLPFVLDNWDLLSGKTVQQAFCLASEMDTRFHESISKLSREEDAGTPPGLTLPSMPSS